MVDGMNEKLRFTIEEASKLGLGSVRKIRYMIKRGDIQCIPPWVEGDKRQKRFIPRDEFVRLGLLPPTAEVDMKLGAAQVLKLKKIEKHLVDILNLKKTLESELWLPPLHYLPAGDLSVRTNTYDSEHTVDWIEGEDGLPAIKLPVESDDNFIYFKQHTEGSGFWQILPEWKKLGGIYIYRRSLLLNYIRGDIQKDTILPIVVGEAKRGVLEGFSWVIFRNLFPQVPQNKRKSGEHVEEAIASANEGRWYEAVEANHKIIKMYPADLYALKRWGKALMELCRNTSAKEAYSRALEVDPHDPVSKKILKELLRKYPDDSSIKVVDGGRYRVVAKWPNLWLIAIFTDDRGENVASVYPVEIDLIIATFQNLLRKYRISDEVKAIIELRRKINQLERSLFQDLKAITLKMIAESKCDGCPI